MANTYTADRVSSEKPWRKVTSLIAGAAIVLSMGSPALATSAIADDKPAATRASEGLAEVYVGTHAASSTVAQVGEGTKDNPFVTLEDALLAVKDGGVVKVLSSGLDLGSTYGRMFSFTSIGKSVTIEAAEESATIATSTPIILGANVTFKNIKFNFTAAGNAYIAANGYSLGLENVSHEGDNKVNLFAGSVKNKNIVSNGSVSTGGLLYGFVPGNGGNIDISGEGTELGDIYAAGVNSSFEKPVKINVSDVGDGKIDNIYSNGAWSIGEALQNLVSDSCESGGNSDEADNDAEQTVRTAGTDKDVDSDTTKRLTPADELKYYDKLYVNLASKVSVANICDKGAALGVVLTVKESTTQPDQTEESKDGKGESSDGAPEAIEPTGEPTTQPDQIEVPEGVEGESEDEGAQPESNIPEIVPDTEPEVTPETSESTTPESTPGAETPAAPESPEVETTTPDTSGPAAPVVPESPSAPSAPENAGTESESTGDGNTASGSTGSAGASDNSSTSDVLGTSSSASGSSPANSTNSNGSSNASSSSSSDRDVSNNSNSSATSSSSASDSSSSTATNDTQIDKGVTVYRLLNPNNSEHLYTTDANEVRVLVGLGWIDEGIGWTAPSAGTGVHRLYNPASGGHLYTKDANEISVLTKLGWKDEGVNFYSAEDASGKPTQGAQAIYRQFNPNNRTGVGTHNFTKDTNEHKTLVARGWHDENIGWYGLK